jgi:hypothetical protein
MFPPAGLSMALIAPREGARSPKRPQTLRKRASYYPKPLLHSTFPAVLTPHDLEATHLGVPFDGSGA